ncbi:MAG TPA: DUF5715 family protein [Longimicrobium sp.]
MEMRGWAMGMAIAALAVCGCARGEADGGARAQAPRREIEEAPPRRPPPPMTGADSARDLARIAARADSVRTAFARARPLGAREVGELRQDVNAGQIATAQRLGIRSSDSTRITALQREGRLVFLGDSTAWWVLRDMDHSVPFATPDARAMLAELGRRFHARLDRLGLPRYRMKVTSALRTAETQADLRRTNSYASRTVSAHEFGTTVDVSHERFAVPAGVGEMEADTLEEIGKANAKVLQAELGRAIAEMRDEHALHVMMENQQPVYHMTVARHFP